MSNEDEAHGFEGFLVDRARRKQAAQQPAPARAHRPAAGTNPTDATP